MKFLMWMGWCVAVLGWFFFWMESKAHKHTLAQFDYDPCPGEFDFGAGLTFCRRPRGHDGDCGLDWSEQDEEQALRRVL